MSGRKLSWLGFGLLATAGASLMGLTAMMNSAFARPRKGSGGRCGIIRTHER